MAIQYAHELDRTFHALGDETRRQMLARISQQGQCSAGEFVNQFDFAQPTISKHQSVLEKAGLVERRVEGRNHIFVLSTARLKEAEIWLRRHRIFWESNLDRLSSFLDETDSESRK